MFTTILGNATCISLYNTCTYIYIYTAHGHMTMVVAVFNTCINYTLVINVVVCIWNSLPKIIHDTPKCITDNGQAHSLQGFSNYAKQYMLRSYNATCLITKCYICSRQADN